MKLKFLKALTIKKKLYSIAIGTTIALIVAGVVFTYFIQEISKHNKLAILAESFLHEISLMRQAEKDFFIQAPKDYYFFTTGKSNYIEKFNEHYDKALKQNRDLEIALKNIDYENIKYEEIKKIIKQYNNAFVELKGLYLEKGSDKIGIRGEIHKELRNLETNITINKFITKINELEAVEHSYFASPSESAKESVFKTIKEIETTIIGDTLISSEFSLALEGYKKQFSKIYEIDKKIGFNVESGLNKKINDEYSIVENILTSIVENIKTENTSTIGSSLFILILLIAVIIISVIILLMRTSYSIVRPLGSFKEYIKRLGKGELPEPFKYKMQDEIGEMSHAVNELTDNLKATKQFVIEVGKGNLETEVNVFNNEGDLGGSLVQMRIELQKIAQEREEKEREDKKRNWGTRGVAKFNDILRKNNEKLEELGYDVLKGIVDYLNACQGVLFIINDTNKEDTHLELIAAYAYSRRKYMEKRLELGEGLAGRCALEKETIYMTSLPEEHFEISTGLGKSSPNSALIVPMKLNEEIFGIVEIASYNEIEKYQIEFAEKIAETVASTIANVKISLQTSRLLGESKLQAEELAAKEEEMRQNMEELQATQEEAARKEGIATGFVNAVNHSIIRADFRLDGTLEYANTKFLDLMGYKSKEAKGLYVTEFVEKQFHESFKSQWQRILRGGKHIEEEIRYETTSGNRWLLATYTSIKDLEGNVQKILFLGIDIHDQKAKNLDFEGELNAINRSIIKAEFYPDGKLFAVNDIYAKLLGYTTRELENKNVFFFIPKENVSEFEFTWTKIADGMPFEDQNKCLTKEGEERWLQGAYTAVQDFDGNVNKVIYIAYDITDRKKMELEAQKKNQELVFKEEDLRKNMQKMQNVQQEMVKKDIEMTGQLNAINKTTAVIEFKPDGTIIEANDIFCELFRYVVNDIRGRHHRMFVKEENIKTEEYKKFWDDLRNGIYKEGEHKRIRKDGKEIFLKGTYTPMFDENGKVFKVMTLAFDITASKRQEAEITGQLEAINRSNAMAEYKLDGTIISTNEIFCELFDYEKEELKGRHHRIFAEESERKSDEYKDFWLALVNGHPQEGENKRIKKDGKAIYLKEILYPMTDTFGKTYKIIQLSFDITQSVKQQKDLLEQAQRMKMQEDILKRALEEAQFKEKEIKQKNEEMQAQEEELRQNLEELAATQEEMVRKQKEVEKANKKMAANEDILRKALQSAKNNEKEIRQKNEEMQAQEEELRQNLEEIAATQEEMIRKQKEVEKANKKMSANESVLKKALMSAKENEKLIKQKNDEMQAQEEELRQNLEELAATQEEMIRKQKEIEGINKKMAGNEAILRKALETSKKKEKEVKEKNKQLQAQEEELKQNLEEISATQEAMAKKQEELKIAIEISKQKEKEINKRSEQIQAQEHMFQSYMEQAQAMQKQFEEQKEENIKQLLDKDKIIEDLKNQLEK